MINNETKNIILKAQKNEITEYNIYSNLSLSIKNDTNQKVLKEIAGDELKHYNLWKNITREEVKPDKLTVLKYRIFSSIFGITFAIKLMEKGESSAQVSYKKLIESVPEAVSIIEDENKHEKELINLIEEEKLKYVSSIVLGLNDALVELTGTLAGFSLVFQKTKLIAVAGLVTGIAGSLSMAASEYLSTKSEGDKLKSPLRASIYTGLIYVLTVFILILPYLLLENPFICLSIVIANVTLIIWIFTFYLSVAKDIPFKERFIEMAAISLGVAALSFLIGYLVRVLFNINI